MIKTIHIDFDGTLFNTHYEKDENGKFWYVREPAPYSIEVTRLLSRKGYELICLTFGTNGEYGTLFKRNLLNKYFPWFTDLIAVPNFKQDFPGIEFLIDDTSLYFSDDKVDGIYLDPLVDSTEYYGTRAKRAYDWVDIARIMGLV